MSVQSNAANGRTIGYLGPTPAEDVDEVRVDDVVLAEMRQAETAGVSIIDTKIYIPGATKANLDRYFLPEIEAALGRILARTPNGAWSDVDVVVQIGTPVAFIHGVQGLTALEARMKNVTGRPSITQMGAMIEAARALKGTRIALATAYIDELNQLMKEHLEAVGFTVLGVEALQMDGVVEIRSLPASATFDLGRQAIKRMPDADVLMISCGALKSFEILDQMEKELGVPIVTSNQAALWQAMRLAGVKDSLVGKGALFRI